MQQTVVSIIPFYDNKQLYSYEHLQTGLMSFASTPSALHSRALVSFPVMAVVSALTLQWDSSLQHYRPDRTTHSDLQLLLLQGHLDHNHSWTLSIRLSFSLSLSLWVHVCLFFFYINTNSPFVPHANSPYGSSPISVFTYTHANVLYRHPCSLTTLGFNA